MDIIRGNLVEDEAMDPSFTSPVGSVVLYGATECPSSLIVLGP